MNRQASLLCPDWVKRAEPIEGVERIEAWFHGKAYAMHRHDTYAIGRTLAGVQSFSYRSSQRNSLPGNTIVLHPDEAHDGQAGTDEGFQYRMIYVEPALFQDVLGGRALPFLDGGVTTDQRSKGDFLAARRARDYLHANCARVVTLDELEVATGRDRWSLSHDFRTFYGTSPYRYLTMRRLDAVRRMLLAGTSLAHAAAAAGFADQSHMTRHFSKTFGLTPGRWLQVAGGVRRG